MSEEEFETQEDPLLHPIEPSQSPEIEEQAFDAEDQSLALKKVFSVLLTSFVLLIVAALFVPRNSGGAQRSTVNEMQRRQDSIDAALRADATAMESFARDSYADDMQSIAPSRSTGSDG